MSVIFCGKKPTLYLWGAVVISAVSSLETSWVSPVIVWVLLPPLHCCPSVTVAPWAAGCAFCHLLFLVREGKVSKEICYGKVRGVRVHRRMSFWFPDYVCGWIVLSLDNCGANKKGNAIYGRHDNSERAVCDPEQSQSQRNLPDATLFLFLRLTESPALAPWKASCTVFMALHGEASFLLSTGLLGVAFTCPGWRAPVTFIDA